MKDFGRADDERGWHDLGANSKSIGHRDATIHLIGNERPWFDLKSRQREELATERIRESAGFANRRLPFAGSD